MPYRCVPQCARHGPMHALAALPRLASGAAVRAHGLAQRAPPRCSQRACHSEPSSRAQSRLAPDPPHIGTDRVKAPSRLCTPRASAPVRICVQCASEPHASAQRRETADPAHCDATDCDRLRHRSPPSLVLPRHADALPRLGTLASRCAKNPMISRTPDPYTGENINGFAGLQKVWKSGRVKSLETRKSPVSRSRSGS